MRAWPLQTIVPAGKGACWDGELLEHGQDTRSTHQKEAVPEEWESRSTQQLDMGSNSRWVPRV